jgi:hypothetical protein
MAQAIEPAPHTLVTAAGPGVVSQRAAVHTGGDCLLGGEIPGLSLSLSVESVMVYVRHIVEVIT